MPRAGRTAVGVVASISAVAACGGEEPPETGIVVLDGEVVGTLPPDVSFVPITEDELMVGAYVAFIEGVTNADVDALRLALCRNVYTDGSVDALAERIADIPADERLGQIESALLSQTPGAMSIRVEATVEGRRGIIGLDIVDDDLGCVRSVETDGATLRLDPDLDL